MRHIPEILVIPDSARKLINAANDDIMTGKWRVNGNSVIDPTRVIDRIRDCFVGTIRPEMEREDIFMLVKMAIGSCATGDLESSSETIQFIGRTFNEDLQEMNKRYPDHPLAVPDIFFTIINLAVPFADKSFKAKCAEWNEANELRPLTIEPLVSE